MAPRRHRSVIFATARHGRVGARRVPRARSPRWRRRTPSSRRRPCSRRRPRTATSSAGSSARSRPRRRSARSGCGSPTGCGSPAPRWRSPASSASPARSIRWSATPTTRPRSTRTCEAPALYFRIAGLGPLRPDPERDARGPRSPAGALREYRTHPRVCFTDTVARCPQLQETAGRSRALRETRTAVRPGPGPGPKPGSEHERRDGDRELAGLLRQLRHDARRRGARTRSTIWMIGSDCRVATATVFFVRLPLPFRAAGRAVITLDRIQTPGGICLGFDSTDPVNLLSM